MEINKLNINYNYKKDNLVTPSIVDILKPNKKENDEGKSLIAQVVKENIKSEKLAKKLASGKTLTEEELNYLKSKKPDLLKKARDLNNKRVSLESDLRSAKTKEEIEFIIKKAKGEAIQCMSSKSEVNFIVGKIQLDLIEKAKEKNRINILI